MERPSSQRARSAAVLLPVLGLFLLMPPFVTLFAGAKWLAGIPLIVLYVFGVWIALVIAAAVLARRLHVQAVAVDALAVSDDRAGVGAGADAPARASGTH